MKRSRKIFATRPDPTISQPRDLVQRSFAARAAQVELATLEYVWGWNNQRLHGELAYCTPTEVKAAYYASRESAQPAIAGQGKRWERNPGRFTEQAVHCSCRIECDMVRIPGLISRRAVVVTLGSLIALALVVGVLWWFVWAPRTTFSCDGLPTGASSPKEAGERFVQAVVDDDPSAMCAVVVDKLSKQELTALGERVRTKLGSPTAAGQVDVRVGDQGGSSYPLILRSSGRSVELSVYSFQGWFRVDV